MKDLKLKLEDICKRFDEQLACFTTDYVMDKNEDGRCSYEVNTISDEDLRLLEKVFYDLDELVENL